MAFDLERENARHAAAWRGFVIFASIATVTVAAVLLLMAVTLL